MDNVKDDKYYIKKMIDDIKFVINNTDGLSLEEFDEDEIINSAVNFKFIQIAESTSKLSDNIINNNPNVPWYKIKGLRNKIVHDYDNVFFDIIFNTIKNDLPQLLIQLTEIYSKQ